MIHKSEIKKYNLIKKKINHEWAKSSGSDNVNSIYKLLSINMHTTAYKSSASDNVNLINS